MKTEETAVAGTYPNRQAADMAVLELASCGIEASITTDNAGGAYPSLDMGNGVAVQVDKSRLTEAKDILEQVKGKDGSTKDEPQNKPKKSNHLLLGFLIGVIVSSAGWWLHIHSHDGTYHSRGGRKETLHYRNGQLDSAEVDRNRDGKPDEWISYKSTLCTKISLDNNFDGFVDKEDIFKNGSIYEELIDSDFNGVFDSRTYFTNGVVAVTEVKPNGTNVVFKKIIFKDGIITEEWMDEDMDGTFDVKKVFDPMGKEISVTKLPK